MRSTHLLPLLLLFSSGPSGCGSASPSSAPTGDAVADQGSDAQTDGPASCAANDPRTVPLTLSVQPDDGDAPIAEAIGRAETSVRVMIYLMGTGNIFDTLKKKATEGKTVRVILDVSQKSTNQKYADGLAAAGAKIQWSDPAFTYMHAKTVVVDDKEAIISTGNFALSYIQKERNYVARDDDPADVASLAALFDADWDRKAPDLSCTRLLVSPINSRERIVALIDSAKTSILVESMQLADDDVRNALAFRKKAGVEVRVLLADPSWIDTNPDAATFCGNFAIPVRWLARPNIHVKSIIVDGVRAYLGSENLTFTSLNKNREVGLIASEPDVLKRMTATFEADWKIATAF